MKFLIFGLHLILCFTSLHAEVITLNISDLNLPNDVNKITNSLERLDTKLLIIGERHNEVYGKRIIAHAISNLTKPNEKLCYFAEEDVTFQRAFDLIPININAAKEQHNYIYKNELEVLGTPFKWGVSKWTDFYNLKLVSNARFKVIAVDEILVDSWINRMRYLYNRIENKQASSDENNEFNYLMLDSRNKIMAKRINNSFMQKDCEFGVFVVGKAHVRSKSNHHKYPIEPLVDLINVPFKTVNVTECQSTESCRQDRDADLSVTIVH